MTEQQQHLTWELEAEPGNDPIYFNTKAESSDNDHLDAAKAAWEKAGKSLKDLTSFRSCSINGERRYYGMISKDAEAWWGLVNHEDTGSYGPHPDNSVQMVYLGRSSTLGNDTPPDVLHMGLIRLLRKWYKHYEEEGYMSCGIVLTPDPHLEEAEEDEEDEEDEE